MKVALLADLHLGFGYTQQSSSPTREDSFRNAAEALRLAAERADVILIAGDVFDRPRFGTDVFLRALDVFDEPRKYPSPLRIVGGTKRAGIFYGTPVLAIRGNHDVAADLNRNMVQLLERAHRLIYLHRNTVVFEDDDGSRLAVTGVGWVPTKSYDRMIAFFSQAVPPPVPGAYNILMIHEPLQNLDVHNRSEVLGANAGEKPLPISALPRGYDLYLAGHIHRHLNRVIGGYHIVMPGSTVRTQFIDSEVVADRRFYVLDTASGSIEEVLIPSARKGRVVRVDVSGKSPAEVRDAASKKIAAALADLPQDPAPYIKLVLEGKSEGVLDLDPVVDRFSSRAIVRVFDSTVSSLAEAIDDAVRAHSTSTEIFSRDYAVSVLTSLLKKAGVKPAEHFDVFINFLLSHGDVQSSSSLDSIADEVRSMILTKRVFDDSERDQDSREDSNIPQRPGASILDWSAP